MACALVGFRVRNRTRIQLRYSWDVARHAVLSACLMGKFVVLYANFFILTQLRTLQ